MDYVTDPELLTNSFYQCAASMRSVSTLHFLIVVTRKSPLKKRELLKVRLRTRSFFFFFFILKEKDQTKLVKDQN